MNDSLLYSITGYYNNGYQTVQQVIYSADSSITFEEKSDYHQFPYTGGGSKMRKKDNLLVVGYGKQLIDNNQPALSTSYPEIFLCQSIVDSACKINYDDGFRFSVLDDILIDKDTNINVLSSYYDSFDSLETVWAQFDRFGNLLQQVSFTEIRSELALNLIETWDGNYMHSFIRWAGFPFYHNRNMGIRKFKPNGDVIWSELYSTLEDELSLQIYPLSDKTFLRMEVYKTGSGNGSSPNNGQFLKIKRIDINGKIIGSYNWSRAEYPFLNSFWMNSPPVLNSDGTLTIPIYTTNPSNKVTPRLIKVDPFMNIIWDRIIQIVPDSLPQQFAYISAAPDGGYYLSGFARDTTNKQRSWILKTDCHGEFSDSTNAPTSCMEFDCTQYPIDAFFMVSDTLIDLAYETGEVTFTQTSPNASSHIWSFDDNTGYASDASPVHTFTQPGIYTVTHEVHVGYCDTTFTQNVHVINTLGLKNQPELTGCYLYPNPTNKEITIVLPNAQTHHIALTALDGKILQEINVNHTQSTLDLSNYAPGLYLVTIANAQGESLTVRVVKE